MYGFALWTGAKVVRLHQVSTSFFFLRWFKSPHAVDSVRMTNETIRIKTRPSVVVGYEIDVLLVNHRLPKWSGMIPCIDPNCCLWEESSYVFNHSCSMALSSLMFIEHNHMMHFDNGPIFVRNNRTYRIGETTLVNPPSWSVMMFNKICFIWSKSIFFYLYHFSTSLIFIIFRPSSRPFSFHSLNVFGLSLIFLELDSPNLAIIDA